MDYAQRSRIDRIYSNPLYLIDFQRDDEAGRNYTFVISGSTANLYKVQLYLDKLLAGQNDYIFCNCPDMRSHASHAGVKCKHCCYVMIKVLRLPEESLIPGRLGAADEELIRTKCQMLQLRSDLTNPDYVAKYKALKARKGEIAGGSVKRIAGDEDDKKAEDKYQVTRDLDDGDDCPICFDALDPEHSFQCPTCRNVVHQICMKKWLSTGHKNCVYCRGDWSELVQKKAKRGGRLAQESFEYDNLANT